ncbi:MULTISPECIES: hypothetical protein [Ruegeria]|uniref:hypothetical protein n=1 Tax=Ruegeria TaxID=97050 RepID=UPI00147A5803|nr:MULTISPECIES: hypothetical protein [Ruegeria]
MSESIRFGDWRRYAVREHFTPAAQRHNIELLRHPPFYCDMTSSRGHLSLLSPRREV